MTQHYLEYYDRCYDPLIENNDMRYDANGNLIYDADREISIIKYNILNLPDTIQFRSGHQIVNLYDAAGRKYKSVIYTNTATAGTQYDEIAHYEFDMDTVVWRVTEYNNNMELVYTREDTITRRIHNSIGYNADGIYYHYIKDHLGNICAVVNSETNTPVQRTTYYASGVPMAENLGPDVPPSLYYAMGVQYTENFGRDEQPYLYNGKEFVEAHGLNEYDSQARMYYAPIMRTITMDLFAENYYHISPYAWCGNNPIAFVDPDGSRPLPIDREYNGWTARVDSWFGPRNTGLRGASTYHKGLDFNYSCGGNGDRGTPILATHEGYAHVVDNIDGNAGRYVEITSEDGTVRTRYLHLSAISIEEGQYVLEADNIGKMGGSGKGSETQWTSHLHYEIQKIVDGKWTSIDPTEGRANNLDNILDPQSIIDVDNKLYYGGELPEIVVLNTSIL